MVLFSKINLLSFIMETFCLHFNWSSIKICMLTYCHQYTDRPACTSGQSDQPLYYNIGYSTSSSHLDFSKTDNGEFQKMGCGLFHLRNSVGERLMKVINHQLTSPNIKSYTVLINSNFKPGSSVLLYSLFGSLWKIKQNYHIKHGARVQ